MDLAASRSHLAGLRGGTGSAAAAAAATGDPSGGSGGVAEEEEEADGAPMLGLSEPYDPLLHEQAPHPAATQRDPECAPTNTRCPALPPPAQLCHECTERKYNVYV